MDFLWTTGAKVLLNRWITQFAPHQNLELVRGHAVQLAQLLDGSSVLQTLLDLAVHTTKNDVLRTEH